MKTDQEQSQNLDCENADEAKPASVFQIVPVIGTETQFKKCCTVCDKTKWSNEFDRNKHKKDGHDSRCKKCVSEIKARAYQKKKKKAKERTQFCASIIGHTEDANTNDFARVIGSAIKEYLDETEKREAK